MTDLRAELSRLRDALARVGATLLAFEVDPTVVLLDAAPLEGRTAARWRVGKAAVAGIYIRRQALGDVLEHAAVARRGELAALLTGPSVSLEGPTVAISDRDLLDASRRLTRSTPDDVLREMTAAFDDVRATVAETAATWAEVLPRVDAARARSAALARQSIALDAREEVPPVDDLARLAAVDPLAFDMDLLTEREERLEALATRLEAAARLRDGLVPLLEGARRDLAAAQAASRQAAAEAVAVSAVVADDRPDLPTGGELTNALEPIAALAAAGAWADAADRLAAWQADLDTMMARVTASTSASRALLATRDELRGRLRAYEAKAEHLGRLEDRTVAAAKRRAAEALTRPPVDLAVAGALVAEYQEVVNAAGERR